MKLIRFVFQFVLIAPILTSGQSSKVILKKCAKNYDNKLNLPIRVEEIRIHPWVYNVDTSSLIIWYDESAQTKYFLFTNQLSKINKDTTWNYSLEKSRMQLHHYSTKNLENQSFGFLPSNENDLAIQPFLFRLNKKTLTRLDTFINGRRCYLFTIHFPDQVDKRLNLRISSRFRHLWIDSATYDICRFEITEKWNGQDFSDCYKLNYLSIDSFEKKKSAVLDHIDPSTLPEQITQTESTKSLAVGDTLFPLMFKNIGGDSISILQLGRSSLVLDFWYTSCGPCVASIPNNNRLDSLIRRYDSQVLGISVINQNDSFLNAFARSHDIRYDILQSDMVTAKNLYRVQFFPELILIDRFGIVKYIEPGYHNKINPELLMEIEALKKQN
ncbi:MAG: redoxin domain-containing protein [Bacteroidetes bacterium]|nr:redoxin domain-containing protein [Bacteroidota bacterium]